MDLTPIAPRHALAAKTPGARTDAQARAAAEAFEAAFLSEMLKTAGVNAMPSGFGGGAGEEAFASLLTDEYAKSMAARGGIGLAERVYQILKSR
jgi:Rod binding domain-containing protein